MHKVARCCCWKSRVRAVEYARTELVFLEMFSRKASPPLIVFAVAVSGGQASAPTAPGIKAEETRALGETSRGHAAMSDARGQHEETRLPEFPLYALPILRFGRSVELRRRGIFRHA